MPEHDNLLNRSNTQFLTGIRGFAALGVLMIHCTGAFEGQSEFLDNILNFGKYGVVVFFVLSAFSLSISMHNNPPSNRRNLAHYWNRRFWRIFPLYAILCTAAWILINNTGIIHSANGSSSSSFTDLFMHLTFLNAFNHEYANSILGVEWTIPLEMLAYAFLPILYYKTKKQSWKVGLLITVILYIVCKQKSLHEAILPEGQMFFKQSFSLWKYFFAFYAGSLAFNRISANGTGRLTEKQSTNLSYALIAILPIFAVFFPTSENLIVTLWVVGIIYTLLGSTKGPRRLFENRLILHIGKISFSVYLLHMLIYHLTMPFLETRLSPIIAFLVFLTIVVSVATLSYQLIEAPFIKFGEAIFLKFDRNSKNESRKSGQH
ncbi:acyltransferase [Puniceicoccaceae bacterium]|nr:acyltransferase [Puniceicoccaceae bacterium]